MPTRNLPPQPSLIHLKHQARDLLATHRAHQADAAQRLREFHPRFRHSSDAEIFAAPLKLSDAQLAIAREYGFPSWPRLKSHIEQPSSADRIRVPHHERIGDPVFRRAVDLLDAGEASELRAHLRHHPGLIHQHVVFDGGNYFHNPTLFEFIAENPIRRGKLPANIVEIAQVILDAGPDQDSRNQALMLVATGSVTRECGVQKPLIELLCRNGADPNSAIHAAAVLHEPESVLALLACGARLDLPVAAALGRLPEAHELLPNASAQDRHLALSVACDYGRTEIARLLLEAGEDPNRYNPIGGHSHATPLHQAAAGGHEDVVRLLLDHGARLNMKDILWHATATEWARHEGRTEVEQYLRRAEEKWAVEN